MPSRYLAFLAAPAMVAAFGASALAQQPVLVAPKAPPEAQSEVPPPPPTTDQATYWEPGHWSWTGTGWSWISGQYVQRPHPSAAWVPGQWVLEPGSGYVWHSGHWEG